MPTALPRKQVSLSPEAQDVLGRLEREGIRVRLSELLIRGGLAVLEEHRVRGGRGARRKVADQIRSGSLDLDLKASKEVRRSGWLH